MQSENRLELCKKAVAAQIVKMAEQNPDRKLGLVAFDDKINIYGDGVEQPKLLEKDQTMRDYDKLMEIGLEEGVERMKAPISQTKDSLLQRVGELRVNGLTALGPAMLTSIAMASKGAPGSQVIVCTDGMANVGIGAFDHYGGGG